MQTRFTIHNALLHAGEWALISRYFGDVVHLEEQGKAGMIGFDGKIDEMMSCVKYMVEQAITSTVKHVMFGIMKDPGVGKFWNRIHVSHSTSFTGLDDAMNLRHRIIPTGRVSD